MSNELRNLRTKWKMDVHLLVDMIIAYNQTPSNELAQKIYKAKDDLCKELQDSMPLMVYSPVPVRNSLQIPQTPYTPRNQILRGNPWSGYIRPPWMTSTRKRGRMNRNENNSINRRNNTRANRVRSNIPSTLVWQNNNS